jgi:hypothetical protein
MNDKVSLDANNHKINLLNLIAQMRHCNGGLTLLVILALIISSRNCDAQNSLELNMISGVKVFTDGDPTLGGKSYGVEAAYNMFQKGRAAEWIKKLHTRDIAIVGGYRNMRNVYMTDSIGSKGFLGSVYTLSGRLNMDLASFNKTELLLVTSLGMSYSTSSFFSDGNLIVGSHINFSPQVGIKLRTPLSGSTSVTAGADFFHYSNIGLQVPNKGVNSFHLTLGIAKDLKNEVKGTSETKADNIRSFVDFGADIGRRGSFKSHAGSWKSGLYAAYNYKLNPVVSIKAGVDAVYYYTTFTGTGETFQYLATSYDPWRVGLSVGGDLWMGKFVMAGGYGYYLKYNSYYPVKYYSTIGFKYYTNTRLGIQMKMYFHRRQADYVGAGLVFRIPTQKFN